MFYKFFLSLKVIFCFAVITISYTTSAQNTYQVEGDKVPFNALTDSIILKHEFRGAWVTTVNSTDWPKNKIIYQKISPDESEKEMQKRILRQIDSQKTSLVEIFNKLKDVGCNAIMFHTISNSDAMYPSKVFPWAAQLTGTQGLNPGYNPLEFAIETAHKLGMEIHAWLNPLRIGSTNIQRTQDHPHKLHPEWVQTVEDMMYWDPGNPEVIEQLNTICSELISNYNLDGIHIDDYFYPSGVRNGTITGWNDEHLYKKFGDTLSLERWREENVNKIIRTMYNAVHKGDKNAIFSVSPGGRLVNTQALYADPQYWIEEGTIDFLAPQIYWRHGHSIADFKKVLDSWKELMKGVACTPGLAAYRWGEKGRFEYLKEFEYQLFEIRDANFVDGHIWFTTSSVLKPIFYKLLKDQLYKYPSLSPDFRKDRIKEDILSPTLRKEKNEIRWENITNAEGYAIYELEIAGIEKNREGGTNKTIWEAHLIKIKTNKEKRKFNCESGKKYAVLAFKGKDRSNLSNVIEID